MNAAGMWGREVGKLAGVNVPLQANEHYYLITEPIPGIHAWTCPFWKIPTIIPISAKNVVA